MFKRLRQLHISLAAKCQILFGTAVAAIIFAALFVPWQRIEQLTEQLNEKAAGAVADAVIGEHISRQTALLDASTSTNAPTRTAIRATSQPTSAPSVAFAQDGQNFPAPRLVGIAALNDPSTLSRFEQA